MPYPSNQFDAAVRFLFDECLTPRLVELVFDHGYVGSHVVQSGLGGRPDWMIANYAVEAGRIFVTNDGKDYRPIYRKFNRHPGLIVILPSVSAARQIDLLTRVLRFIDDQITVVDQLVQIDKHGKITMQDWTAQPI
ncbi:hypothetical protein IP69_06960 [Bosea sp. AAP35]|nr:hypothetical protein IP69_06960 [Bosea sp. AAP35]